MTPQATSWASQPRGIALANGTRLVGVDSFEVDNNSFYQADTFRLTLALSAQPASSNWAFWASQVDIEVELCIGYPTTEQYEKTDITSMIVGEVDEIEIDPLRDEIVMSGRDLTARFVDNKTTEKYPNLTASQIATKLALARGLTPVVTATTVKAGTYYDIDKVDLADDRPEWDLLTYLAQVSGFVVYVKGYELHFEPKPVDVVTKTPIDKDSLRKQYKQVGDAWTAELAKSKALTDQCTTLLNQRDQTTDPSARAALNTQVKSLNDQATAIQDAARAKYKGPYESLRKQLDGPDYIQSGAAYVIHWEPANSRNGSPMLNAVALRMSRNLTIAKDIVVSVRSYNVKQKTGFTKTANRSRVKAGTKTASKSYIAPQKYFFTIANKTAEETQQYANQKLAEISQHEMNFTAQIPGDPALTPRVMVRLEGTGTSFDQLFYPASVLTEFSMRSGYKTTVRGKNSSPESTVAP